jgi:two-component system OmpR family response regulator
MTDDRGHILVVDDDQEIRRSLAEYLRRRGFRASVAADSVEMDRVLATAQVDLAVLDLLMPGEDGFSICRRLQETSQIPVILLTALAEEADRIVGLELGADDYVTKPCNPRELVARVRSVLRRSRMLPPRRPRAAGLVAFDRWRFDLTRREIVGPDGVAIRLSSGEHRLLLAFIEHAGLTLSRDQLLELTRGREAQAFDRSVDNQVSRLRRKLELDPQSPRIIQTDWGGGYVFAAMLEWQS